MPESLTVDPVDQKHALLSDFPKVSQKLRLSCEACSQTGVYEVGTILVDQADGPSAELRYGFSGYFRCRNCGGPGPWKIVDRDKLVWHTLRSMSDQKYQGVRMGKCQLFDGTFIQAPAMGEAHLLTLIERAPENAFLCSRLGNLLRNCDQRLKAWPWYEKAILLDPGELESRYELFSEAAKQGHLQGALTHGLALVQSLIEGRKTENQEINNDLALSIVEDLRDAPEVFRQEFLQEAVRHPDSKAILFVRTLLEQEGDEKEIVNDAVERLLSGRPQPPEPVRAEGSGEILAALAPSLRQVVEAKGLNATNLSVALRADGKGHVRIQNRHDVLISDGKKVANWRVPALSELYRGSQQPPPDMDHYPAEYAWHFIQIENHLLTLCDALGDRTDQEMEEVYATLRRRPDGRSLGAVHDFLWQVAALLLGRQPLSAAEFEALFGQLTRSVRKWALNPVSRYYVGYLRTALEELRGAPGLLRDQPMHRG